MRAVTGRPPALLQAWMKMGAILFHVWLVRSRRLVPVSPSRSRPRCSRRTAVAGDFQTAVVTIITGWRAHPGIGCSAGSCGRESRGSAVMSLADDKKLAISSWVNDQFETGSPIELRRRPRDVDDLPHWKSDPNSGVTGDVYLGDRDVSYHAPDTPPRSGWWNMGLLPSNLR